MYTFSLHIRHSPEELTQYINIIRPPPLHCMVWSLRDLLKIDVRSRLQNNSASLCADAAGSAASPLMITQTRCPIGKLGQGSDCKLRHLSAVYYRRTLMASSSSSSSR